MTPLESWLLVGGVTANVWAWCIYAWVRNV